MRKDIDLPIQEYLPAIGRLKQFWKISYAISRR